MPATLPIESYNGGVAAAGGLTTNLPVVMGSTLAVTGAITATGGVAGTLTGAVTGTTGTFSSTLDVTGATTLGGPVNFKRQVTDTGGAFATPIALTEAQSGRVILVDDSSGLDFTLPAIAAAQIGTHYRFLVTVSVATNSFRVTAQSGDLLNGAVWIADFNTANTGSYFAADDSDDLIFTANGTTTGGKKGSFIDFIATTANQWSVTGNLYGDGTLATPFS